jgi:hypothetical protein
MERMNCIQYFKMHQVNMLIVGGNVGLENFRFAKSSLMQMLRLLLLGFT